MAVFVSCQALLACGAEQDASPAKPAVPEFARCVDVRDGETLLRPAGSFQVLYDLVYDPGQPDELGRGDLYLPVGADGPVPTVLFIHGGGWTGGHKGLRNAVLLGEHLACMGVAMFDIDYDLASRSPMVEQVRHTKCALRWLRGEAEQFGLDPQRIGVTGGSAGGHLTGLVATTAGETLFDPTCDVHPGQPADVAMAFPFYGIFDMVSMQEQRIDFTDNGERYLGIENPTEADWRVVSATTYASADDPPMLLITGRGDALVPWQQAVEMGEALDAVGVENEVLIVEGGQHGFDAFLNSPESRQALQALTAFVERHLLGKQP
jgi:acetyl esterase/lipase